MPGDRQLIGGHLSRGLGRKMRERNRNDEQVGWRRLLHVGILLLVCSSVEGRRSRAWIAASMASGNLETTANATSLTESRGEASLEDASHRVGGLLLGKDRELFHASIDLRQAWSKLTDGASWVALFQRIIKTLSHVSGAEDNQQIFKEIAIELTCAIRKANQDAHIKLFQGTIKQAELFARKTGRFIVVYIEDGSPSRGDSRAAQTSEAFRKAFSENYLADLLNDKFVFYAGSTAHAPTNNMAKLLGYSKKDLPLFAILTPAYLDVPSIDKKRAGALPEIIVTLRLSSQDIDAAKVQKFLNRVIEVHGPVLVSKKREFDDLVAAEKQMATLESQKREADERVKSDTRRRALLLRQLPTEPVQGGIKVTILLANGKMLERRFLPSEPALALVSWADAHAAFNPRDAELVAKHNKGVVLRQSDLLRQPQTTLQEMGMVKDTTLFPQPQPNLSRFTNPGSI